MDVFSKALPGDHDLILAGDAHEGTSLQHKDGLYEMRETVATKKNTFLAFGGDIIEAIMVDDKRYDHDTTDDPLPLRQYRAMKEFFRPIANKTLFILEGNHDRALRNVGSYLKTELCPDLGIHYGTFTTKMEVKDKHGNRYYKLFYTHGSTRIYSTADDPIRAEANMLLQLKRKLKMKAADCEVMAMAHTHRLLISPPMSILYLYDLNGHVKSGYTGITTGQGRYIHPDHRWYVNTGSFLKLYGEMVSGYAERFGYDPMELGYTIIECRAGKIANIRKVVLG